MADLSDPREVSEHLPEVQIVDVREQYEFDAGRIDGAIHIPLNPLMGGAGDEFLDKGRPVVVVCRSGNRSQVAAEVLIQQGYADISNVQGGMIAWRRAGLSMR